MDIEVATGVGVGVGIAVGCDWGTVNMGPVQLYWSTDADSVVSGHGIGFLAQGHLEPSGSETI